MYISVLADLQSSKKRHPLCFGLPPLLVTSLKTFPIYIQNNFTSWVCFDVHKYEYIYSCVYRICKYYKEIQRLEQSEKTIKVE